MTIPVNTCGHCEHWQHLDHESRKFFGRCGHLAHDGEGRDRFDGCDDFSLKTEERVQ